VVEVGNIYIYLYMIYFTYNFDMILKDI